MFSFTHIAIIFLIALLVFGPEKLPEIARTVGKFMGDFRKASTDFQRVIQQEFSEIERQQREKEEAARQKALAASNPTPATAPAAAADATAPGTEAAATAETGTELPAESSAPAVDPAATAAPALPSSGQAGTVANTTARDSGHTPAEQQTAPADVHPA